MRRIGAVAVAVLLSLMAAPILAQCVFGIEAPQQIPLNGTTIWVIAGDFDGDGDDDLIVSDWLARKSWLVPHASRPTAVVPIAGDLVPARAVDIDGDGRSEALVPGNHSLLFVTIAGDGTWHELRHLDIDGYETGVVTGHFTGQRLQFAILHYIGPAALTLEIRDAETMAVVRGFTLAETDGNHELAAGDLNGDGIDDLVVVYEGHPTGLPHDFYSRLEGNIATFISNRTSADAIETFYQSHSGLFWPVLGDFDGDGRLDLAVVEQWPGELRIFQGDGRGGFAAPRSVPWDNRPQIPSALNVADVNRDGRDDIVSADGRTALLGFATRDAWTLSRLGSNVYDTVLVRSRGERVPSLVTYGGGAVLVLRPTCVRGRAAGR